MKDKDDAGNYWDGVPDPFIRRPLNPKKIIISTLISSQVRIKEDELNGILAAQLEGFLYGETLVQRAIKYPANWKEAVKERFLPEWARKRWPVIYETSIISADALYPDFRPVGGMKSVVIIAEERSKFTEEDFRRVMANLQSKPK